MKLGPILGALGGGLAGTALMGGMGGAGGMAAMSPILAMLLRNKKKQPGKKPMSEWSPLDPNAAAIGFGGVSPYGP